MPTHLRPLDPDDRTALDVLVVDHGGVPAAAKVIGCGREALRTALAGANLQPATRTRIAENSFIRTIKRKRATPSGAPPRKGPAPLPKPVLGALRLLVRECGHYGVCARLGLDSDVIRAAANGDRVMPSVAQLIAGSMWLRKFLPDDPEPPPAAPGAAKAAA